MDDSSGSVSATPRRLRTKSDPMLVPHPSHLAEVEPSDARSEPPADKRRSLTATDWVNAAIDILVTRSIEHVRVELLAKRLRATKGSFYWHFKNHAALLDAIVDEWIRRNVAHVEELQRETGISARQRLRRLLEFHSLTTSSWFDLEIAMWSWSREYQPARQAVMEVDRHRLDYVHGIFASLGFDAAEASQRALVFYGTSQALGRTVDSRRLDSTALDRILALILAEATK
jgi:AcrR family transcriptional regulator